LRKFVRIVVHPRCIHVAQEMRLYSFKVDRLTGDVLPDLVDKHNHTLDALRYALQVLIRAGNAAGLIAFYNAERDAKPQPEVAVPALAGYIANTPTVSSMEERVKREGIVVVEMQSPWHREDGKWN